MGRCLVLFCAALGLFGCKLDLGDAPFLCNTGNPKCPSGYECNKANVCVPEGSCPAGVAGCPALPVAAQCGDGTCGDGEACDTCEKDCGKCTSPSCGDGSCGDGESCSTCEKDCGACTSPGCGDGTCGDGESCESCEKDCGACTPNCGNNTCETGESCSTCEKDCGPCGPSCGNNKCETGETCGNCEKDCGKCPPSCGNGTCDTGETCTNCESDCGKCAPVCGDGTCDAGETTASCPGDCKPPPECTAGQTQCDGADALKFCEATLWQTSTCSAICTQESFDYAVECRLVPQQSKELCICANYAKFGEICNSDVKCDTGLFCGVFGATATQGYCSKYCTTTCTGAPAGTTAQCVLDVGGQLACGFTCDNGEPCPTNTTCDSTSGLCMP